MMITKTVAALIGGASLLTAMLGGCVMKSEATAESKAAHMYCVDTRDGEKFAFKGATVRNASVGFGGADSCFDVTTDDGKPRLLCKSHEAFIKCENKTPVRAVAVEGTVMQQEVTK